MYHLKESSVHVVAAECRTAVEDFDTAYASSLRLAADTVDGLRGSGLPSGQSQRLYRTFSESFENLLEGRKNLVAAIGQLQVIHKRSTQAETSGGCPVPGTMPCSQPPRVRSRAIRPLPSVSSCRRTAEG